jgi:hypothetical protein
MKTVVLPFKEHTMKNKMPGELNALISKNICKMMDYTGETVRHIKIQIHVNIDVHRSGDNDMLITTYEAISDYFFLRHDQLISKNFNPATAVYVAGGREKLYMKNKSVLQENHTGLHPVHA